MRGEGGAPLRAMLSLPPDAIHAGPGGDWAVRCSRCGFQAANDENAAPLDAALRFHASRKDKMTPTNPRKTATPERAIGIKDIAQALGVSTGTFDRALHAKPGINPMTRARVLRMAESLGYRPNLAARYLKSRRARSEE